MLWSLAGHPKLPPGLAGNLLQQETEQAELLLGLRGYVITDFTAEQAGDLIRALVLQVGLQTEQDPETFLAESIARGAEDIEFRGDVVVHPVAKAIVDAVIAAVPLPAAEATTGNYIKVQSLR